MTAQSPAMDEKKMEEFGGRMLAALNGSAVTMLTAVGRQTGLFEVMAKLPASTSQQIAGAAGLNERYVREWLGGMAVSRFVDYDPATKTYVLPPEHAPYLMKAGGTSDIGAMMPVIMDVSRLQDKVVESFRNGGGVPYAAYPEFQEVQFGLTAPMLDASLVSTILPMAGGVTERLLDGGDALDIGCGAGHASNVLAAAFPNSRFVGYDFATDGIALARQESSERRLTNTRFETRDIANLDEHEAYDLITAIEVVHDLAQPEKVLRSVYEAVKPGGVFLIVDINASSNLEENMDHPIGPGLFMFSIYHCMTVSLAQGGAGLGTMVGEQKVTELLQQAGFASVEIKHLDGDFFYSYYIASKS